jgi:tetratricopeptide (TPR) repeat protein
MCKRMLLLIAACAVTLAGGLCAQTPSMDSMPGMGGEEHHHHHDAPAADEKLGAVSFPTSCAAGSQGPMQRGVALLHSFGYTEAQMQFEAIVKDDPKCAMAHWGVAMTQYQELWGRPEDERLKRGAEEMAKARALAAAPGAVTPREKAYIAALNAFFDGADTDFQKRADKYEAAMNTLHKDFPDDVEGAAFDALAIIAATPPTDTSLTHEREALAILIPLFAAHPDHPGLAHYIIHTCDTPALAQEGLEAAREYAKIAPSSPHALHMPGHIFARLGMWQEDIDSNLASVKASEAAMAAGQPGAAHQMHADEFLIYAYLQVGEDEKAKVLTDNMQALGEHMSSMPGMDDMKYSGNRFDNELRVVYAVEMHQWKTLEGLKPGPGSKEYEKADIFWGQGIAAGHLRDAKLAASALAGIDACMESLKASRYAEYLSGLEIKRNEIVGWKEYAEGHADAAVVAMRKAADQQDKLGQNEVDIPAREMLGDLLVMEKKPSEALAEYKVALKLSPNRLNGLLSAGNAAEEAKLPGEAHAYYEAAAKQTNFGVDSKRPELAHAVEMVKTGSEAVAGR